MLALFFVFAALPAQAFEWSFAAAMAQANYPVYRGADSRETLIVPVPALAIWDERWRLGRRGAQYDFFKDARFRLRLSAGGSLPVDSDKAQRRKGMADLDPSLEIGPALSFDYRALRSELLLRSVIASDLRHVDAIGWVSQLRIGTRFQKELEGRFGDTLDGKIMFGPLFATRRYHDYFYTVRPHEALPDRPAYKARGGFSGWRLNGRISWKKGNWRFVTYAGYDLLNDASFIDSPLVERDDYLVVGTFLSWQLYNSTD